MTKRMQTTKKKYSSWWSCCFATPRSSLSSPSRHGDGVSSGPTAEPSLPINVGVRCHSAPTQLSVYQEMELDRSLEKVATLDVASSSRSAVSADEETELDRSLEEVAALIVNKLREIKGLKLKDVAKEGEEIIFSWDFRKINSDGFKRLKQILEEGMSCAESLQKYVPEHGGKELRHAIIPILEDIGSYHWITTALLVVGKTLERWESVTKNKEECLSLLEEMAGLALILKQIRDRKMQNQNMESLIKEALERMFNGYLFCSYQMSSSRLHGMFVATYDESTLSQLRLEMDKTYKKIMSQMTICIYDAITCINKAPARPRNVIYPKHAVGIDGQVKEIIKMLDYESDEKALAVVLHNFGGMGKTTLAEAVFSSLAIKNCKYSMVKLFKDTKAVPDIVQLQKTIIGDLTEEQPKNIQTYQEGQVELEKILKECNAFIYIDNVLESENSNSDELEQLLPRDLISAKKARLLITARDSNLVRRNLASSSCNSKVHMVKGIADEHAEYLLREGCRNKLSQIESRELIEMCRGVPLLVKLVASFIKTYRGGSQEKEAYKAVKSRYDMNFSPTGSRSLTETFAIDTLEAECRECFFDICCFFHGRTYTSWHLLKIIYGEHLLDILQSKALISLESSEGRYSQLEIFDEGVVRVHDVLIDIARRSSAGTRLNSIDKLRQIIHKSDNEREIMRIGGLQCYDSNLSISAKDIDQLHDCLRVLDLPYASVEGQCSSSFPHMKYLYTRYPQFKKLPNLRVLRVPDGTGQIHPCRLVHLQYLDVQSLGEYTQNICDLFPSLRSLVMRDCRDVKTLPANIGCLTSLEALRLDCCFSLEALPASFSNLVSLRFLALQGCWSLTTIPDNVFHNMPLLTYLCLSGSKIRKLPSKISCPSLLVLDLQRSTELEELPESICNLSEMRVLRVGHYCSSMNKLPQGIGRLTKLVELDLSWCVNLQELPQGFGELQSLETLNLGELECLKVLPRDFGCLRKLKELYMRGCRSLQEFCNDFVQLQSLTTLELKRCPMLRGECMDVITKLPSLKKVEITGSNHLIKRWLLCYREYNIVKFDHMQAMYEDLFGQEYDQLASSHPLVGKDGQVRVTDPYIPLLIITESSTEPNKLEYLKSVLSRIDKRVPVIHIGDRCVGLPQEIEDAIVARATPDSVAFLLWTYCCQQLLEFSNNVSLVYVMIPWNFDWKPLEEEYIVRMSTKYLNMQRIYRCLQETQSKEWLILLLKEMMEPRKREDGKPQLKLQVSRNGKEMVVGDLEGKDVCIVAFPSTFLQAFTDLDKEKFCHKYQQIAQDERKEVICTKRRDASDEFNQWIMNNIPDCILLESLDSLTMDAIQFLFDEKKGKKDNWYDEYEWFEEEFDDEGIWVLNLY